MSTGDPNTSSLALEGMLIKIKKKKNWIVLPPSDHVSFFSLNWFFLVASASILAFRAPRTVLRLVVVVVRHGPEKLSGSLPEARETRQ